MLKYFLVVLIVAALLLTHVNSRGSDVIVEPDDFKVYVGPQFKRFNPSSCTLHGINVIACRHSLRNICPSKFMPPIFPLYDEYTTETTSYILLRSYKNGNLELTKHLDTSAAGFGHYEDARLCVIGSKIAVVCTKYLEKIARICLVIIDPETLTTQGSIEFLCTSQSQKNWVPRTENTSLLLYSSLENSIVHEVPNAASLTGHHLVYIGPCKIGKWRGSSGIIDTQLGTIAVVHHRTKETIFNWIIKERFLPHYAFCFARFENNVVALYSRTFTLNIKGFSGFVYVSGLEELIDGNFELCCGVTDCYAVKIIMKRAFVQALFDNYEMPQAHYEFSPSDVL